MLKDQICTQRSTEDDEPESLDKVTHCASRDNRLQTSRRIDWRFLLPNPDLRRVAYLGREGGTLLVALKQFSGSLTILSPSDPANSAPENYSSFELVVLQSPSLADLDKAKTFVMPGGYLYWEIDRRQTWQEHRRFRHFRDYVVRLERLGFRNVHVSWHRPNFESCLEIIPLDDPLALGYVFSRHPSNLLGQIKLATGRYLMKTHLLARLVPCLSVVGCKRLTSTEEI